MKNESSKWWKCPYCKKKMLESAKEMHLSTCDVKNNVSSLVCKWCGKSGFKKVSAHAFHQNRCYSNPNRKPWSFEGKIHKFETKLKQAKSFIPNEEPIDLFSLSSRTRSKVLERMKMCCSLCGWAEGSVDLHHIIPKKDGGKDTLDNITPICPNCHRMVHNGFISPDDLMSFTDLYGDSWKNLYLSNGHVRGMSYYSNDGEYKKGGITTIKTFSEKTCEHCGKPFLTKRDSQKFCSLSCASQHQKTFISKEDLVEAMKTIKSKMGLCAHFHVKFYTLNEYLEKYNLETSYKNPKNSKIQSGEGNSNYGNVWIYNDEIKKSKLIPKSLLEDFLSNGWNKGRKMKFN